MSPWLTDIAKEVIVALLVSGFTWLGHLAARLSRDLNAAFLKIRDLEKQVKRMERELEIEPCEEE